MRLCDALGVQRGEIVAFVGSGGKTSALVQLGRELHAQNWRVLATTTTRIAQDELTCFPCAVRLDTLNSSLELTGLLAQHGFVFLYEEVVGEKALGIPPETISGLADSLASDAILIEADGARQLPLKAPKPHEPVLPIDTSLAVPVVGMDAVGQPFNDEHVYNIEKIIDRYGFPLETPIQHAWIAQIVRDETLGLQGIPAHTRIVPLLNKTGQSMIERIKARRTAQLILREKRIDAVAIGRAQQEKHPVYETQRRVAAVVLAGGLSTRMGQSKPLLPWGKRTVIETIARRLLPLRLADILVVTGYRAGDVANTLKPTGVRTVHNPAFATGEMLSSLQTGLSALDDSIAACLVFLGDQPQINMRLVNDILTAYAEGEGGIVAPSFNRRRGHPILIDRRYWREILDLPPGSAPRDVINAYQDEIKYIVTRDDSVLRDLDTPEEYKAALKRAGLL